MTYTGRFLSQSDTESPSGSGLEMFLCSYKEGPRRLAGKNQMPEQGESPDRKMIPKKRGNPASPDSITVISMLEELVQVWLIPREPLKN